MIVERWRAMGPVARALLGAVVVVVALNLVLGGVTVVTGGSGPGGPTSSSYATGDDGLAALAELLARHGHAVERVRVSLDRAALDPAATLVVADPTAMTEDEGRAVAAFVDAGGHLVAAGPGAAPVLAGLPGGGPEWDVAGVASAHPLAPVPEVAGVTTVEAGGTGAWGEPGGTLPFLGGVDGGALATVASVGRGRVVALADASPLQNRFLARADNAAFALAVAGGRGRPVAFAEAQHGYGRGTGLAAVPARWRWAAAGGFVAAVVWMWSRGRRLGPPDELERSEPPPRRAYVEALAGALARTRQPDVVVAPLQERARRRVAERAGLPADAAEGDLRLAAARLGLPAGDIESLFGSPRSDAEVVAVGRAAAQLVERRP